MEQPAPLPDDGRSHAAPHRAHPLRLLLLVVFVITLWVPFFNRTGPTLFGFPFFYWYQMLAVLISSGLITIVFLAEDRPIRRLEGRGQ